MIAKEGEKTTVDIDEMKHYIRDSGIKQKRIAAKSGLDEAKFSMVLQGKRKLEAGEYAAICDALGVPMEKFVKPRRPDGEEAE